MATDSNDPPPPPSPPPTADNHEESVTEDFAQALRHIARGEQAASALEANLDTLESKLDELLAAASDTATAQGSVPPGQNGARTNGDSSKEVNGVNGVHGVNGVNGVNGVHGVNGVNGVNGDDKESH